ncbi:MAG: DNA translocase FtsK [Planctomycetes bacterium]|nr:DNA translocase FtsK [Planctomycetota bacterium]
MSRSSEAKAGEGAPKRRATRFVALEDVPAPGMSERTREVVALLLCGFALYALLCLGTFRLAAFDGTIPSGGLQNLGGAVGYYLACGFVRALGYAGWAPFVLLFGGSIALLVGRPLERAVVKVLGATVFAAMLAILFAGADGLAGFGELTPYGAGGRFGAVVSPRLDAAFGASGRLLLVGFGSIVAVLLATEWLFSELLARAFGLLERGWRRVRGLPQPAAAVALAGASDCAVEAPRGSAQTGDADRAQGPTDGLRDSGTEEAPPEGSSRAARRANRRRVESAAPGADAPEPAAAPAPEPAPEPAVALAPAIQAPRVEAASPGVPASAAAAEQAVGAEVAAAGAPAEPPPAPPLVLRPRPRPKPKARQRRPGQNTLPFDEAYPYPPIELFQEAVHTDLGATADVLARGGQAIVQKLANFDIEAKVVAASVGPAVTQYELRVADSVRVHKVVGFESDLAAVLKAVSVRVVAPIPGKDTIGVEVPNPQRQKVYMRDLLEQFGRAEDLAIPLFLGKDVAGNPIVEDLARMPHLLIAGTTGSGKSVCINTILSSILMSRTPQQVKLILVDPKMVELQAYKRVPHLCCDVVTNMKKAPAVLQWAVDEMENRYALLSAAGVNHVRNYNRLGQQELEKRMQREVDPDRVQLPYIVIVIDEFADLMNVAQNEVEELIQRLAQKSRAVGQHVIVATQRPSSEVITGIIKANLPCQISFKVSRKIDSRVILDANGAEKLLGFGDMLYMPPSGGALLRAQGTFVADDEVAAVVRYLEQHGQQPDFDPELVQKQSSSRPSIADRDDLYREAVEVVLGQQRGSATLLQRALAVGYTRATRLLELMEADGLVGPFAGSRSRDVLLTLDEWKAREAQMAEAMEQLEDGAAQTGDEPGGEPGDEPGDEGAGAGAAPAVDGEVEPDAPVQDDEPAPEPDSGRGAVGAQDALPGEGEPAPGRES